MSNKSTMGNKSPSAPRIPLCAHRATRQMRRAPAIAGFWKVRLAGLLSLPPVGAFIGCVCRDRIRNRGIIIDTSPSEFSPRVKARLAFGIYESAEIRFIRRYLRGSRHVLELGASLGVSTSHILDVAAPGAEVVCVEANPDLLGTLRATTVAAAARGGAQVRTIHGAVPADPDSCAEPVVITLGASHLGSRVNPSGEPPARIGKRQREIHVRPVDLAAEIQGWIDYALVCDIEGAEAAWILTANPVWASASRLVIELHDGEYKGAPVTASDLKDALLKMGFKILDERGRVLALEATRSARPDIATASSRR